jgi:hypothetical protein
MSPQDLARQILPLRNDNLVPRPWGGFRLRAFKQLPDAGDAVRFGESFEVAAAPGDTEAAAYPSRIQCPDGADIVLADLLTEQGAAILGRAANGGAELPLLPKFLDVKSLLSVQAHPAGNPECYIILDADPGATLRLGFCRDVGGTELTEACQRGRREQQELLAMCADQVDPAALHTALAPLFARRDAPTAALATAIAPLLPDGHVTAPVLKLLDALHARYWEMLDRLNEIPLHPGQVLFNVTPDRLRRDGPHNAEVHALGDPGEHEVLLLEIRRPGPTYRAWDNVRFPLRELDIERAIGALNLAATHPDEFIAGDLATTRCGEARTLVTCDTFSVLHLAPEVTADLRLDTEDYPITLHGIAGRVRVSSDADDRTIVLARGESALLPAALGQCRFRAEAPGAQLIAVRVHG